MGIAAQMQRFLAKKELAFYRGALLRWYGAQLRDLPWRRDFCRSKDPYHVWVSEVMLQQTLIKAVIPAYERFMIRFPGVQELARASVSEVCQVCHGLGYYRRFRLMHEAAISLVGAQGERAVNWPQSYAAWLEVRGIGTYSAAAIASIALGAPHAVVDGNVERIFCRLLDIRLPTKDPSLAAPFASLAAGLLTQTAGGGAAGDCHPGDYNQAIMELGQTVCTRSSPACDLCPLRDLCTAAARGSQHLAPAARTAAQMDEISMDLFIRRDKAGRIALVVRDQKARFLKQSLGFPWHIVEKTATSVSAVRTPASFRHSITHHKLQVQVHLTGGRLPRGAVHWVPVNEVEPLLVASLDRKAWRLARSLLAET